jgi:truncated hemoglobin YjbI
MRPLENSIMRNKIIFLSLASALVAGCGDDTTTVPDAGTNYMPTGKGPGTSLRCKSSGKNAWDTFGVDAFVKVNEAIVQKTLAELGGSNGTKNLGTSFTRIGSNDTPAYKDDAATFKGKLAAFLVYAYGGPDSITYTDGKMYTGPQDMAAAHVGMAITNSQYDYFIANMVVPALTDNGVTADDVSTCFAPIVTDATFKASIVGK